MATKRMYSTKITDSDAFIEMSSSSQALYFHLNQGADDDGFNNQIQVAMMKSHSSTDDLKVLMAKKFIIRFDNGVIVIKHWRIHNTLRKDRFAPTNFQDELKQLGVKESGAYTLNKNNLLPNGCQVVAIDKIRIDKDSIEENSKEKNKDIFCNSDFQKTFVIYSENCKNLLPLLFEKRNREVLTLLGQVLEEIDYDFEQFKELCIKANSLEKIVNSKIDFKSMLKNYIGILSGKYETGGIDTSKIDFS